MKKIIFLTPFVAFFMFFQGFSQKDIRKTLLQKWILIEIKMDKRIITEQELQSKDRMVMEFQENGKCLLIPSNRKAQIKTNRWVLGEDDKTIIINSKNDFGGELRQNMLIEEISNKKLVLSAGEGKDKETYTYKQFKGKVEQAVISNKIQDRK
jgi:hypothetical protein